MANQLIFNDSKFNVGDRISVLYRIKEGDKERVQEFKGMLIQVKGATPETKMLTIRRVSKSGIGIERIIPVSSPYLSGIKLIKQAKYTKAKAYFVRQLSEFEVRKKVFKS